MRSIIFVVIFYVKGKASEMKQTKIALALSGQYRLSAAEQIELYSKVGFNGFFFGLHEKTDIKAIVEASEKFGMEIGSVHAPFMRCDRLWENTDGTEDAIEDVTGCIRACGEYGIPIVVAHVVIGFDKHEPTEFGLRSFERIVSEAEKHMVKLAFENTEGEEYLDAVMAHFKGNSSVGFCLDTGHEICYNPTRDMVSDYGDRLIYTHINDNLGVCGKDITYLDDLHLLPFDGVCDFDRVARRLAACGFDGTLSFELSMESKPGRSENDKYADMGTEAYLEDAYRRAKRVAELFDGYRKK